jgi:hypothetical protein
MDWLTFSRGPLFKFALLFFVLGMVYRFLRIMLMGWKKDYSPPRGSDAPSPGDRIGWK